MRDSIVGDQWIYQTAQSVPIQRVIDPKTGLPTGDILTGPVRLAFDNLFELPAKTDDVDNPKFGAALLFSPWADFAVMYEEYYKKCAEKFASYYDAQSGQYHGLYSPFRQQAEKIKFGGFTPGLVFMTCTSKFKPPVVDIRQNPIVDRSKVYPGVWAICAVSPYSFDDKRKKGVAFGLQSVMIIGDDTKFGGKAPDTKTTFGGVAGVAAPVVRPEHLAGMPTQTQQPPQGGIPGYSPNPAPQAALAAPYGQPPHMTPQQGYAAVAGAPNGAPVVPQHQPYMPPQMPGQPVGGHYAAPATADDDDMSFMQ